jgi:hypothetical protein
VTTTAGVVCHKDGFGCTVTLDDGTATDHDIEVPSSIGDRGEALAWIASEATRLAALCGLDSVAVQKAGGGKFGASAERHEVEAAVQIGIHKADVSCIRMNREQVRAAMGVPKAKGAYEKLLALPDVSDRSNASRRDQYLLALAQRQ